MAITAMAGMAVAGVMAADIGVMDMADTGVMADIIIKSLKIPCN
jgi:hypothetical protein